MTRIAFSKRSFMQNLTILAPAVWAAREGGLKNRLFTKRSVNAFQRIRGMQEQRSARDRRKIHVTRRIGNAVGMGVAKLYKERVQNEEFIGRFKVAKRWKKKCVKTLTI